MAIQSKLYTRISAHSQVLLEVWMEYDDADYQSLNDDGDPDDFRVVRWYGTNHSDRPRSVTLFRPNGSVWRGRTIPAGESFSQNAGGPVKYESDIPRWVYG